MGDILIKAFMNRFELEMFCIYIIILDSYIIDGKIEEAIFVKNGTFENMFNHLFPGS